MIKIGDIIKATVTGITDYGFFISTDEGYSGLCHISEISNSFVADINTFIHENEILYVQVLSVDEENKHLKVSIKDIYYKTEDDGNHIVESRKGFLPLKEMLPTWIEKKIEEYKQES